MKQKIDKPWGYEEIWAKTDDYVGKIIVINAGQRLSKQYHEKKKKREERNRVKLVSQFQREEEEETWREEETFVRPVSSSVVFRYTATPS